MSRTIVGQVSVGGKDLPIAKANVAGGLIFLSGQLPLDAQGKPAGDTIEAQTRLTIENLKSALALCGARLSDIVKVTVWLTDAKHFPGFNKVYADYFSEAPPARSTAICGLTVDAFIELDVIAVAPDA